MTIFALSAAVLLALAGADPVTETPTQPAPQQSAQSGEQPSARKLYCAVETQTASRLRKKQCRTRADWIALTGTDPAEEARK
ncbi:hypothetical protein [Sphingomonas sp. UNC305MFCol5.2]|uniref:hypothetical protein n=1 Tax=Sphingomonas sp. UNC305MFCol5.2 TaxID=1449076 RepID=UPI0004A6ED6E|nr:hypothetical protein [Sphingomonas sp. UNC305MFCol5.2]